MNELIEDHARATEPTIINILYEYIDKYPDDAPKWVEFFRSKENDGELMGRRRRIRRYRHSESDIDSILESMEFPDEPGEVIQITPEIGCLHCNKTWLETPNMVRMNLLCGHTYHTLCTFLYSHYHDDMNCIVENCNYVNIHVLVDRIVSLRRRRNNQLEDVLTKNILENGVFQKEFALMKRQVVAVNKTLSLYDKQAIRLRKNIIKKHLHSINYIQEDMNTTVKNLSSSQQKKNIRSAVCKYRKTAASMFRKFHVSFRDLHRKNMIKCSWRLRHILERHGTPTNNYRFGIRIYPGKKVWRDPNIDVEE